MKMIRIENFKIDNNVENLSEKIEIPSEIEMEVASLVDENGGHLVKLWMEPSRSMFSPSLDKIRNRASAEKFDAIYIDGYTPVNNFVDLAGDNGLEVKFLSFGGIEWKSTEHTFFVVAKLGANMIGTNTSLLGRMIKDGSVNTPNLNIHSTGTFRFYMSGGVSDLGLSYVAPAGVINETFLAVVSQSKSKGITFRLNGSEVAKTTSENAKRPGSNTTLKFLGSEVVSASFQGIVGTSLLCSKDLSGTEELLIIERYLLDKYKIK